MSYLPENLVVIRTTWKLSQDEFAQKLNVKRGSIAHYETGRTEPSLEFMTLLQNLTGIEMYLIVNTELMKKDVPIRPLSNYEYVTQTRQVNEPGPAGSGMNDHPKLFDEDRFWSIIKEMQDDLKAFKDKLSKLK